jgi:acyl-CoA dehydrogenase
MLDYRAPLRDMRFVMEELCQLDAISQLPGCEEATPDLVQAILEEGGKFATEVLSPLNRVGDKEGCRLADGQVTTPTGWQEAYRQFREAGWTAVACDPAYGGQGLPKLVSTAVMELWKSANMAFSLCPMLTQGAIEALMLCGTEEQKTRYLPKMVSGEWTGTMNLTEPQAGSDLSAVRTRAEPTGDGRYQLFGQKIFITYGEHNLSENIVHLVLARLPDAPEGVKGISLFVVPKYLVNDDGSLGARNDVRCVSIEHKLGIHGSPTCVLSFGDQGGAIGELVGEPNRGLEYMFIMMNEARFAVGMEGLALAERAWQQAAHYAHERIQGFEVGQKGGERVPILKHPDVRRMLLTIKAHTEAMRAMNYHVAAAFDLARHHPDSAVRERSQAYLELMIPVVKGWCTERAVVLTSLNVQVHGGMGFIEETGAAQLFRDARITPIYEGTTAIQANDLIGRKIARNGGAVAQALADEMDKSVAALREQGDPLLARIADRLAQGVAALRAGVAFILDHYFRDPKTAHASSVPLLELFGVVCGGWHMARAALVSHAQLAGQCEDPDFYRAKLATARFYAEHVLPQATALSETVCSGAAATVEYPEALLANA